MFEYIKKVVYEKQQSLFPKETFLIGNLENIYELTYPDINEKDGYKTKEIKKELAEEYFDKLFRLINRWEKHYENTKDVIMDGTQWKLQIEYINGEIREYTGKNEFPYNFEDLEEINKALINESYK